MATASDYARLLPAALLRPRPRLCIRAAAIGDRKRPFVSLPALPALFVAVSSQGRAQAVTAEQVAGTLNEVQGFADKVISTARSVYGTASEVANDVISFLRPAFDVAFPVVKQASDAAIQVASPLATNAASQAVKSLEAAGLDTKPVVDAGKAAVNVAGKAAEQTTTFIQVAKPVASTTWESLLTTDPLVLAGEGGLLLLVYFLGPSILSGFGDVLRGYRGDLTAPQALDFVSSGKYTLVDIRTEKEKGKSGLPSLPNNAKKKLVSVPIEEFPSKLRSQLKNPRTAEAEVAAIKISSLKRLNRGSRIILLDSNGSIAKSVAKALAAQGFKNAWVVLDGFDGKRGWLQNRLGTESYNLSFAEVLSPSRIISPTVVTRSTKLLPSGSE